MVDIQVYITEFFQLFWMLEMFDNKALENYTGFVTYAKFLLWGMRQKSLQNKISCFHSEHLKVRNNKTLAGLPIRTMCTMHYNAKGRGNSSLSTTSPLIMDVLCGPAVSARATMRGTSPAGSSWLYNSSWFSQTTKRQAQPQDEGESFKRDTFCFMKNALHCPQFSPFTKHSWKLLCELDSATTGYGKVLPTKRRLLILTLPQTGCVCLTNKSPSLSGSLRLKTYEKLN